MCSRTGSIFSRRSRRRAAARRPRSGSIGEALVRLLAPIMSFTCEEIWQYLPKTEAREDSVHLAHFPSTAQILGDSAIPATDSKSHEEWTSLRSVRDEVLKALEEARNNKLIGTGLEAQVAITASDPVYSLLKRTPSNSATCSSSPQVTLAQGSGNGTGGVHVEVKKADGAKCDRCWNYSTHVGEDKAYPTSASAAARC